jgi:1,4-alpha-glucan branching enzyme
MKNPVAFRFFRYLLKDYDYIICVGKLLDKDFGAKFGFSANKILCAGVNKAVFKPLLVEKDFDFLFAGSLIDRKGFDIVLKIIEKTIPMGYKWCVVGTGTYNKEIKKIADENGKQCEFYEGVDQEDLNIIFNRSKWFFFPSRNEPFGLVATESVFAGTPVISSPSGGLAEQIKHNLNGFILTQPENIEYCIEQLMQAYSLPAKEYKRLRDNCLKMNNEFSLNNVGDFLIELYSQI